MGNRQHDPENLEELVDYLHQAGDTHADDEVHVSIGTMLSAVGHRSFGALLLVPGLLLFSPLSGIPGLPTLCGVLVALIAGQLLAGRSHFWLPQWLLKRSVPRKRFLRATLFLQPWARRVDRFIKPRLKILTHGPAKPLVAIICLVIALSMPPLELIPFANSLSGAALSAIGLGLIARDGALLAVTLALYLVGLGILIYQFL
ncbi:exopolysaccharide biosynthesis protein [Halomonas shantousis]